MADLTKTEGAYRALLIPDPKFTYEALDLENSVLAQRGARAGVPVPTAPTKAVLAATGEQEDVELTIRTARGGFVDSERGGAAFVFEASDDAGTIYGWETPTAVTDVQEVAFAPAFSGSSAFTNSPACLALPGGGLIVSYNRQMPSGKDHVFTKYRSEIGVWASAVDTGIESESFPGFESKTCLVYDKELDIVRLYVLYQDNSAAAVSVGRLALYTSDNSGTSWTFSQSDCLRESFNWEISATGYTVEKISIAINQGQALLMISATITDATVDSEVLNTVIQYVSDDDGYNFSKVEEYAPTSAVAPYDSRAGSNYSVIPNPRGPGFKVFWSSADPIGVPALADIGAAVLPWSYVYPQTQDFALIGAITSKLITQIPMAVVSDPSGGTWIYYSGYEAGSIPLIKTVYVSKVTDDTCLAPAVSPQAFDVPAIYRAASDVEVLDQLAACWDRGRVVLVARIATSSTSARAGSLLVFNLGGYTTHSRERAAFATSLDLANAAYDHNYIGFTNISDFPDWTTSSTATVSMESDVSTQIVATGIQNYSAEYALSDTDTQLHCQFGISPLAGSFDLFVRIKDKNSFRIRLTSTTATLRDVTSGTDLSTITFTSPGRQIIRLGWNEEASGTSGAWAWAVTRFEEGSALRKWQGDSGTGLAFGTFADSYVKLSTVTATSCTVKVFSIEFGSGIQGAGLGGTTLTPRPYSFEPSYVYGGVSASLITGPSAVGDEWTINPRYDYGIQRVFQEIEPSPRAFFQSTNSASSTPSALVFNLQDSGEASRFGSPVLGMGLFGANFRTAYIQTASAATGPWTTIKTIDMSCGLNGLAWERTGHTVSAPATSPATGPHYIAENALAGSYFQYKSGEMAKILRNSGGLWQEGANVARARLMLSGASADASGSGGVIVYKDAVVLIYGLASVSFMRLLIPAQDTYGDTLELGSLVFGRIEILARQYGRGRSLEIAPNVELVEQVNGARKSRKLGPSRRVMTVSWANENAIDTKQLWGDLDNVDYVRASAGLTPAAIPAATAHQVAGLVDQLEGEPLVYISKLTPDQPTMIAPTHLLRGRVLNPVTLDHFDGNEEEDEIIRVASIVIEEEV